MLEELARHGYSISPGPLYPMLHGLEQKGYLRSWEARDGRSRRRVFRATPLGEDAAAALPSAFRRGRFLGAVGWSDPFLAVRRASTVVTIRTP